MTHAWLLIVLLYHPTPRGLESTITHETFISRTACEAAALERAQITRKRVADTLFCVPDVEDFR